MGSPCNAQMPSDIACGGLSGGLPAELHGCSQGAHVQGPTVEVSAPSVAFLPTNHPPVFSSLGGSSSRYLSKVCPTRLKSRTQNIRIWSKERLID